MDEKSIHSMSDEELQAIRDKYTFNEVSAMYGITIRQAEYVFRKRGIKKDKEEVRKRSAEVLKNARANWLKSNLAKNEEKAKKRGAVKSQELKQVKQEIICNVEVTVIKRECSDFRNVMSREIYDPKKQGVTWSYKR